MNPRLPELEWAAQSAAGELVQLQWVDTSLDPRHPPLTHDRGRFFALPYTAFLPPAMVEAAQQAQAQGQAPGIEVLMLLLARIEWLMATQNVLWTSLSPAPALLATLVETFGIEPAIHRHDPAVLARLVALLPAWFPYRGPAARAAQVLTCADHALPALRDERRPPELAQEVLVCHRVRWWKNRGEVKPVYKIEGGLLRFQPAEPLPLRREDVLWIWSGPLPPALPRLLPPWATLRLARPIEQKESR